MESTVHFVLAQAAMIGGALLLSRTMPWTQAVGFLLIAEGVVSGVYALMANREKTDEKPWHEGS